MSFVSASTYQQNYLLAEIIEQEIAPRLLAWSMDKSQLKKTAELY